ncbi:hypothetical protein LEP1GSC096_2984 [Leptospira interrogans serovar Hebdomadis str. R499]|uniref:Uncharacterized protein n=1 Tax=Leptospira interrogans serovar Hebdomadis TaxID=211881 RepID=D4HT58_LEPIR|nr:hypothetical protein [Leptospira interrogans]ADC94091.1 hypothetical protein [Leptospira interrogans serovar Hebdomadis]EKR34155.1 hypothetical protein LEP1GSC096_2984 [Leptospira interrogans serovar Hebdomadis str. R499]OQM31000.1 hypothetical protein DV38_08290 [Leptospira interrogans]
MKALITFNHPGGKNVVLPIARHLLRENSDLELDFVITSDLEELEKDLQARSKVFLFSEVVNSEELQILNWNQYRFILAGTSISGNLEKVVVREARKNKIRSYSIVDHWCNYRTRYEEVENTLDSMPDVIFTPDDLARHEMTDLGFDPSRLVTSGHPGLGQIGIRANPISDSIKKKILNKLEISPSWKFAVFISEPISQDENSDSLLDERKVLSDFITSNLDWLEKNKIKLFVKLHPREDADKYHFLPIPTIPKEMDRFEVVQSAFFVLGIDSMLLLESSLLEVPTYSLSVGAGGKLSIGERLGWVKSFSQRERDLILITNINRLNKDYLRHRDSVLTISSVLQFS